MKITVNGQPKEVEDGCTAAQVVIQLAASSSGIAVAVNGEILPRNHWNAALTDGAMVEVLTAVQGG